MDAGRFAVFASLPLAYPFLPPEESFYLVVVRVYKGQLWHAIMEQILRRLFIEEVHALLTT